MRRFAVSSHARNLKLLASTGVTQLRDVTVDIYVYIYLSMDVTAVTLELVSSNFVVPFVAILFKSEANYVDAGHYSLQGYLKLIATFEDNPLNS